MGSLPARRRPRPCRAGRRRDAAERRSTEPGRKRPPPDLARIAEECRGRLTPALRGELAAALGLPASALAALPMLGWAAEGPHREPRGPCWTFPEVDAAGNVVGVVCRYRDGRKKAWPGGGRGLTVPAGWHGGDGPVFLPEGPSDVLALAAGLAAVGRPSNMGGVEGLAGLLCGLPAGRPIVALGENDAKQSGEWPGRDGEKRPPASANCWAGPSLGAAAGRGEGRAGLADRPAHRPGPAGRMGRGRPPAGRDTETGRPQGAGNDAGRDGRRPPKSAASRLIDLADGLGVQLFHDAEGGGYADVFAGEAAARRRETWPLRSKGFAVWLARSFHAACRRAPGSQAVADAVSALDGKARFDGPESPRSRPRRRTGRPHLPRPGRRRLAGRGSRPRTAGKSSPSRPSVSVARAACGRCRTGPRRPPRRAAAIRQPARRRRRRRRLAPPGVVAGAGPPPAAPTRCSSARRSGVRKIHHRPRGDS